MAQTDTKVDNGVNVEALLGARKALTEAPEAARFTWRASCEWVNGTHSQSSVQGFFGLGAQPQTQSSQRGFGVRAVDLDVAFFGLNFQIAFQKFDQRNHGHSRQYTSHAARIG